MNDKVTFLVSSLAGGGAEGVSVNLINGLAENGWNVDLLVLNLNRTILLDRVSDKVNLVNLNVKHARLSGFALLKYIYSCNPKVLLVFNHELSSILAALRLIFRFRTKIISRNINTLSQKKSEAQGIWVKYVVWSFINRFYLEVDYVINQCEAMRDDMISLFPSLTQKSSVIFNPLSKHIEEYISLNDLSTVVKKDYILCVGRLERQKAFHFAIMGFAEIAKKFPSLRLKILGQGSLLESLKCCANDLGVGDRVDFEGFQNDMIPFYVNARATVLTSLYEGYPNVLIESLALGTPVIAFNCPSGPSEIIRQGENGYLVEHLNLEDLRNKLIRILEEKFNTQNLTLSISDNRFKKVLEKYMILISSLF